MRRPGCTPDARRHDGRLRRGGPRRDRNAGRLKKEDGPGARPN